MIRGLMGADNLIVIDGLRYNTSVFRREADRQVNSLGLYSFEGLELIRGGGGVGYGSGALGGVLSLRTRDLFRPDKRWWYWREFFAYPGNTRYNFTSLLKKQIGASAWRSPRRRQVPRAASWRDLRWVQRDPQGGSRTVGLARQDELRHGALAYERRLSRDEGQRRRRGGPARAR